MTLASVNSKIRTAFPLAHRLARSTAQFFFLNAPLCRRGIPAIPRTLGGDRIWAHPRFCATPLDPEPHVRRWLQQYLQTGATFFDIGAHVGWHSIYAAKLVGETGRVIAFEASPTNAFFLNFHRIKNHLSHFEVIEAAVTDQLSGRVSFHLLNGGDSTSNSIHFGEAYASSQANQSVTTVSVPATTIDAHSRRHSPDLIKIDIEGAELPALRAAEYTMSHCRPPIILAVHPLWFPTNSNTQQLLDLLHTRGYEVFSIDNRLATAFEFSDYLCLPVERVNLSGSSAQS